MNKYKKGFTPDEAAFIAINLSSTDAYKSCGIDLSSYLKIEAAITKVKEAIKFIEALSETSNIEDEEKSELFNLEIVGKLLNQALEIKVALIDETYRAYEYEHNNSDKETKLKVYSEFYFSEYENILWAEKTRLTKESLADWFADIGEIEISKKFRTLKKIVPINPFKKALTAEHAALIATGLQEYHSIENAERRADEQAYSLGEALIEIERGGEADNFEMDEKLDSNLIGNAISLKEALLEEIKLASEIEQYRSSLNDWAEIGMSSPPEPLSTDILIFRQEVDDESTLVTKESVAIWLWRSGQNDYARIIHSDIENLIEKNESDKPQIRQQSFSQGQKVAVKDESAITIRTPESSLMDSLGIMAWLLSEKTGKYKRGDKPNSLQIKTAIESVIIELGLNENTDNKIMISNLNKDIGVAVKQLENRFKL